MIELTETQEEFIIDKFFTKSGYPQWEIIGNKLLEHGKCIVGNDDSLYWMGTISKFIETTELESSYNSKLYSFNIEEFLKSEFFKKTLTDYIENLNKEILQLEIKRDALVEEGKEISLLLK